MSEGASFSLALTGDSILVRRASVYQDGPFGKILRVIRDADLAFTNLEVLPNDFRGYPAFDSGGSHLGAHAWVLDDLLAMGFDLFAAATNHSLNYSIAGLLATMEVLDARGATYAGIGHNLAEARMPAYLDHPGGTLAMISCASSFGKGQEAAEQRPDLPGRPGLNPLRVDRVYEVTPEQLGVLRAIAEELGLERQRLENVQLGFGFPPDSPDLFPFLESNFRAAARPAVKTAPKKKDLEAIAAWVREARGRADTVLVSLHAHEQGDSNEEPAAFIRTFAHRMIDEGADLVVGHGPHLLRGMELYHGKPAFYSLGNFFGQNELVYKLPADSYDHFRVDQSKTPGDVYRIRSEDGQKGFPADHRYWETLVPLVRFVDGAVQEIELVPVSLGHGEPPHRRGRPRLAEGAAGTAILERFAALSKPYGTRLGIGAGRAVVMLDR
ncbi:MAG TPA: CapA family protein [Thermomicrobiaceae bacterium]|nr:CapA family protein [Thermomicrobiaceae bacterium]